MQPSILAKRLWLLFFLLIVTFYLWGLGALPLVGPDEPRYAEVAREMLLRRDLITPTLAGLPWFEKPALLYWLIIGSFRVFGVNEYSARLPSALCGLLTALFIYWVGVTVERRTAEEYQPREGLGKYSALVWLSSVGAIGISRGVSFDGLITMTLTGALSCFFVWEVREGSSSSQTRSRAASRNLPLAGFYCFVGLSLLAKGLIGVVIPAGVVLAYLFAIRKRQNRALMKSLFWGAPLALLIAASWYGPMIARHGWLFIDQFIVRHHFARFVTNRFHHPQPFYFYVPVLLLMCLPWTVVLIIGFINLRRLNHYSASALDRARLFSLIWILLPFVFFSLSRSKLPGYILPALPAIALLVGERIVCFLRAGRGDRLLRATGVLLVLIVIGTAFVLVRNFGLSWWQVGAITTPLLLVALLSLARPALRRPLFVLISAGMLAASGLLLKIAGPMIAPDWSVRDLISAASDRGYASAPLVQLHAIERTAEFYAAGRLSYRPDGEPIKLEGVSQVAEEARRSGLVLCLVPTTFESQLTGDQEVRTEVIGRNGHVTLLAVRPVKEATT